MPWHRLGKINVYGLSEPYDSTSLELTAHRHQPVELHLNRLDRAEQWKLVSSLLRYRRNAEIKDDGLEQLEAVLAAKLTNTEVANFINPGNSLLAQKQLSLTISTTLQKVGLALCLFTFPLWCVAGSFGTLAILPTIASRNVPAILITLLFPLMFILGLVTTTAFFDKVLTFSEAGITFPLYLAPFLRFRRERRWNEVSRIRFISPRKGELKKGEIDIFVGRDHIRISLAQFHRTELEALLLALNIWALHCEQDPELKLLQENLSNEKLGLAESSYTKVWEAEMNRRFSSTSFVPKQAGQTLRDGSLSITKQIAYGGMSAVYLCQMNQTELVVLKEFVVPNLDSALQSKARELFEREAKLLMKLSHPRIAKVLDHFVEDQRTYLLLEYIQGTDLRQLVMQNGKQSEDLVLSWARQLIDILIYLHGQNPPVLHRDLTPDNIMLTPDQQITLIDFGAANEFVGTATGTLVGKESFIAPEQFRGETVPQSDIYSLGATMHYLLTGEEPQPLSQSVPQQSNPQVSEWLSSIVAKCTDFDAENRFSSAADLAQILSAKALTKKLKEPA